MREIKLRIPDPIFTSLAALANAKQHSVEDLAIDVLTALVHRPVPNDASPEGELNKPIKHFDVREYFSFAPEGSQRRTQIFVDAALSYIGVSAFANDCGIGFSPNFIFIERVYTEEFEGFYASFGCSPEDFSRYGIQVENGRRHQWSRLKVKSDGDLEIAIKCLHIAANAKGVERAE
jgi:hypothetical protein